MLLLFLSLGWVGENLPVGRQSENREPIRDRESLERERNWHPDLKIPIKLDSNLLSRPEHLFFLN